MTTKMNWTDLVKTRMKEIGLTQAGLAEKMGSAQGTIARYLTKAREPSLDTIAEIMKCVGLSHMTLLPDGSVISDDGLNNVIPMDIQPEYKGSFPVLGKVSAGRFREAIQTYDLEYLDTTVKCSRDSFWLIVDGHSMTAPFGQGITFPEGMFILVDPEREYINKNFVVGYCENKQMATFKQISIEPEGTFLVPLNPDPTYKRINIADEFCEIAGVVIDAKWKLF
ncbi:MAG: S24 family peptidase [Vibrio sp.]